MAKIKSKVNNLIDNTKVPTTVDIISNKEAVVSNCKGVLEYDDSIVKLNCGDLIIDFTGSGLSIKTLSIEEILITGGIVKIEYSNN